MELLVAEQNSYFFSKKLQSPLCMIWLIMRTHHDGIWSMCAHVLLECLSVYLHTHWLDYPLGSGLMGCPVTTVIRDIIFNVNVAMALNQLVGLFCFCMQETVTEQIQRHTCKIQQQKIYIDFDIFSFTTLERIYITAFCGCLIYIHF